MTRLRVALLGTSVEFVARKLPDGQQVAIVSGRTLNHEWFHWRRKPKGGSWVDHVTLETESLVDSQRERMSAPTPMAAE